MGRGGARRGQRGRGRGAVVAPGRHPRGPRPRRAADEPRARHGPARRLPGARRAPAAGAHPRARRGRARAHGGWHRRNGIACLALLVAHTVLITAGYALDDGVSLTRETGDLLTRYSGVLLATIGLGAARGVVVTSVVAVRRRLSYRVWHALHVSRLPRDRARRSAISSPPAASSRASRVARAYWWALYAVALGALVGLRLVLPVARSLRHRLRIERVVPEAPGVVSLEIGGVGLERLRGARGPVAALALPRARALVGDAPVLAVGRARRAAAAHHGQGRRRLHAPARVAAGRDARDRRGAVGRADERRAPPSAGRADRRRRGHRADPRAARGHAGRAGHDRRHLPRGQRGRRPLPRRARRARAPARRRAALRAGRAPRRRAAVGRAPAGAGARHRRPRRLRLRAAADDRGHAREPAPRRRLRARHIISEGFGW